jgi:hypothetical protein
MRESESSERRRDSRTDAGNKFGLVACRGTNLTNNGIFMASSRRAFQAYGYEATRKAAWR